MLTRQNAGVSLSEILGSDSLQSGGGFPDVVIGCGRTTAPACAQVRRSSEGEAFCVQIQDPRCPQTGLFDAVRIFPALALRQQSACDRKSCCHRGDRLMQRQGSPQSGTASESSFSRSELWNEGPTICNRINHRAGTACIDAVFGCQIVTPAHDHRLGGGESGQRLLRWGDGGRILTVGSLHRVTEDVLEAAQGREEIRDEVRLLPLPHSGVAHLVPSCPGLALLHLRQIWTRKQAAHANRRRMAGKGQSSTREIGDFDVLLREPTL